MLQSDQFAISHDVGRESLCDAFLTGDGRDVNQNGDDFVSSWNLARVLALAPRP